MDHRHTVFDGDPLRTVFLHIELRAPQAGKNDRLPGKEQAGSVELGENIDGKVELAERLEAGFWIRHCNGKVSAKRDAGARAPFAHCLQRFHCGMAMRSEELRLGNECVRQWKY